MNVSKDSCKCLLFKLDVNSRDVQEIKFEKFVYNFSKLGSWSDD